MYPFTDRQPGRNPAIRSWGDPSLCSGSAINVRAHVRRL